MKTAKQRNDERTELTTSRRRSVACGGRNDDTGSMTHPTDGTCGIMYRCARRGTRDSIRDGANRIDARECPSPRRRLVDFHSKPFGRTSQGCTLAQMLALFLQKCFANLGLGTGGWGGQKLGIDALNRKRPVARGRTAYPKNGQRWPAARYSRIRSQERLTLSVIGARWPGQRVPMSNDRHFC